MLENDQVEEIILTLDDKLSKTISVLEEDFSAIRAGRANPHILDKVMVDYYGAMTPVTQTSNISVQEGRCLVIAPWDVSLLKGIEKAILTSNIGINPTNDGKVIRLVFPELTEERRKDLCKQIKRMGEDAKVAERNVRREAMDSLKKLKNDKTLSEDEFASYEKDVEKMVSDAVAKGSSDKRPVEILERLMRQLRLHPEDRAVVVPARQAAHEASLAHALEGVACGAALELPDGAIVRGKNSPHLHAAAATVLNAVKRLAGIPQARHLLAPETIASVTHMKQGILKGKYGSLNLDETLVSLAICAATDPDAKAALERLADLRDCEMHLSHMLTPGDEAGLRRLGIRATNDPLFATAELFVDA